MSVYCLFKSSRTLGWILNYTPNNLCIWEQMILQATRLSSSFITATANPHLEVQYQAMTVGFSRRGSTESTPLTQVSSKQLCTSSMCWQRRQIESSDSSTNSATISLDSPIFFQWDHSLYQQLPFQVTILMIQTLRLCFFYILWF